MASSSFDIVKSNLPLTYTYSACLLTANICSLISLHIVNHQECFKNIITTVIFSRNHLPKRPRLHPFFMLIPHRFVKRNFIGHHGREWPGINQSAAIFLPPCALAYDVMPICVDANMTTGEVVHHLLINFPLFLTIDGRSMSATRCQHLTVTGRHAMSTCI